MIKYRERREGIKGIISHLDYGGILGRPLDRPLSRTRLDDGGSSRSSWYTDDQPVPEPDDVSGTEEQQEADTGSSEHEVCMQKLRERQSVLENQERKRSVGFPVIYKVDVRWRENPTSYEFDRQDDETFDAVVIHFGLYRSDDQRRRGPFEALRDPLGETLKLDVVLKFLEHIGKTSEDWKEISARVVPEPLDMKRRYDGHRDFDLSKECIQSDLALDAIFLACVYSCNYLRSAELKPLRLCNSELFEVYIRLRGGVFAAVCRDALKLENQIPLELIRNVLAIMLQSGTPNAIEQSTFGRCLIQANAKLDIICERVVDHVYRNSFPSSLVVKRRAETVKLHECHHLLHCVAQTLWVGAELHTSSISVKLCARLASEDAGDSARLASEDAGDSEEVSMPMRKQLKKSSSICSRTPTDPDRESGARRLGGGLACGESLDLEAAADTNMLTEHLNLEGSSENTKNEGNAQSAENAKNAEKARNVASVWSADNDRKAKWMTRQLKKLCCLSFYSRKPGGQSHRDVQDEYAPLLTATQLVQLGIEFRGQEVFWPKFKKHALFPWKATLFLPRIRDIYDTTPERWKNLLAFEYLYQFERRGERPFMTYLAFMDDLINTKEDVSILCSGKDPVILHIGLGENKSVADLFNSMTKNHFATQSKEISLVKKQIHAFVNAPFRHFWSAFGETVSRRPWLPLSIFAAVSLLVLTVVQTAYTIKSFQQG